MAPGTRSQTRNAEQSSAERISRVCQTLRQRTEKAVEASMRFTLQDSPETEALALKKISEQLQEYLDELTEPRYYRALESIFDIGHGTKLTQCICLGLGNFDIIASQKNENYSMFSHISLHQLAVLMVMLEILPDEHSIEEVYFQDPAFTGVEKGFLQCLGYTVLESPAAFEIMTTSTVFFAPFLPYHVAASALEVAFPALYIGNNPGEVLASLRCPEEASNQELMIIIGIFDRFVNSTVYGERMPSFDHYIRTWTNGTVVRLLKPAVARDAENRP